MKRLVLLRHAKSSWDDPTLGDKARPLNSRGKRAAEEVAIYLAGQKIHPGLVLCSSAQRTRETFARLVEKFTHQYTVSFRDDLYHASTTGMIAALAEVPQTQDCVMLIGHNPGMEELAYSLAGKGHPETLELMGTKYPTAAIAVIDFDIPRWQEIPGSSGTLERFVRPVDISQ